MTAGIKSLRIACRFWTSCLGVCERPPEPGPARCHRLVPLHRGFDGLLVVSAQGRQSGGVDEHFDAAGDARLPSDEPGALEREDHLVGAFHLRHAQGVDAA
jgi:hypothetical protein